jgi:hypothetical protein
MKVGQVSQATAHNLELKKLAQQELLKQQQLKVIVERQKELERIRPQDLDKGQNIDKMV